MDVIFSAGFEADDRPKQTWKANIDFKFIRENKDAIAKNIQNRKSGGDVEQVVQLYEQSVSLNQVITALWHYYQHGEYYRRLHNHAEGT